MLLIVPGEVPHIIHASQEVQAIFESPTEINISFINYDCYI